MIILLLIRIRIITINIIIMNDNLDRAVNTKYFYRALTENTCYLIINITSLKKTGYHQQLDTPNIPLHWLRPIAAHTLPIRRSVWTSNNSLGRFPDRWPDDAVIDDAVAVAVTWTDAPYIGSDASVGRTCPLATDCPARGRLDGRFQ